MSVGRFTCDNVRLSRLVAVGRLFCADCLRLVGWLLCTWHCWLGCGSGALCRSFGVSRFLSVATYGSIAIA